MKKSEAGQGLIVYALILVLLVIVFFVLVTMIFNGGVTSPCDYTRPTAGQVVDCIATRTAEAKNR